MTIKQTWLESLMNRPLVGRNLLQFASKFERRYNGPGSGSRWPPPPVPKADAVAEAINAAIKDAMSRGSELRISDYDWGCSQIPVISVGDGTSCHSDASNGRKMLSATLNGNTIYLTPHLGASMRANNGYEGMGGAGGGTGTAAAFASSTTSLVCVPTARDLVGAIYDPPSTIGLMFAYAVVSPTYGVYLYRVSDMSYVFAPRTTYGAGAYINWLDTVNAVSDSGCRTEPILDLFDGVNNVVYRVGMDLALLDTFTPGGSVMGSGLGEEGMGSTDHRGSLRGRCKRLARRHEQAHAI